MGEIIIRVPGNIRKEFEIKSESNLKKLLELIQKENKEEIIKSVVGLWSCRYEKEESSAEIGKNLRKELWKR
jgi:transcriptional regulator of NAD metabolism